MGTHHPRLDVKGRLALPARFRADLSDGVVVTKGQERCLYAFPLPEFNRLTAALSTAPLTARTVRDYTRIFFGSAFSDTPDGQGRITLPTALRDYAGLTKDCAVVGANTRVEIWDSAAWDAFLTDSEPAFSDAIEEVIPGVL